MTNCTALSNTGTSLLSPVTTSLENLPVRLGKRLWVTPAEFLQTTCAMQVARWAVNLFPPSLPDSHRRGRKRRYSDESILLVAYIQSAWQMSYEMVVDYFRSHPEAAKQAGFEDGQVISVGQYWERRRTLGMGVLAVLRGHGLAIVSPQNHSWSGCGAGFHNPTGLVPLRPGCWMEFS